MRASLYIMWLWLVPAALLAADYPVRMTILDFSTYGRFDLAGMTELAAVAPTPDAAQNGGTPPARFRTETSGIFGSFRIVDGALCPTALLRETQMPPLLAMLYGGYISKTIYDAVIEAADIWDPSQVRFAYTWSEMSRDEAEALFPDGIPWHRVMHGDQDPILKELEDPSWRPNRVWDWQMQWPNHRQMRIVRAMMMVGVGQVLDVRTGKLAPKLMAWQKETAHAGIATLDRGKFPLVAEFSRALSEPAPLKGDLRQPTNALVGLLLKEARLFGNAPEEYSIFARGFSRDRILLFERFYGARTFSPEVKTWFETNPDDARRFYHSSIPKNREPGTDTIVMATLPELSRSFTPDAFSQRIHDVMRLSGGTLSAARARELIETLYLAIRPSFNVNLPGRAEPFGPVMVMNNSPAFQPMLVRKMIDLGVTSDRAAEELLHYLTRFEGFLTDPFGVHWRDRTAGITPSADEIFLGMGIHNLEETAARESRDYLPAVLIGVRRHYLRELSTADPVYRDILNQVVNGIRGMRHLPPIASPISPETALDHFRLRIGTTSRFIADRLNAMGIPRAPHPSGSSYIFELSYAEIAALERRHPALAVDGVLSPSPYRQWYLVQAACHY